MVYKGTISTIDGNKCKVILERYGTVTSNLDILEDNINQNGTIAPHDELAVGDKVVVAFYDDSMRNGVVLGRVK